MQSRTVDMDVSACKASGFGEGSFGSVPPFASRMLRVKAKGRAATAPNVEVYFKHIEVDKSLGGSYARNGQVIPVTTAVTLLEGFGRVDADERSSSSPISTTPRRSHSASR